MLDEVVGLGLRFFLFFALHCRRVSVLHLEPIGRAAGTVWRILPLRDNAFEAELAGVPEYGLAVAFHVLIESDAYADLGQDDLKRGLPTFKRMTPEIVAVKFDQIECVKEYAFVMAAVADAIERSNAVVITGNRLAVDDAGARPQAGQGLDDQREA